MYNIVRIAVCCCWSIFQKNKRNRKSNITYTQSISIATRNQISFWLEYEKNNNVSICARIQEHRPCLKNKVSEFRLLGSWSTRQDSQILRPSLHRLEAAKDSSYNLGKHESSSFLSSFENSYFEGWTLLFSNYSRPRTPKRIWVVELQNLIIEQTFRILQSQNFLLIWLTYTLGGEDFCFFRETQYG